MNRSCILIGAPGSEAKQNYLNGVSLDMYNMRNYLRSNTGGAWKDYEIMDIVNPTSLQLLIALNNAKKSDFSLILFSGHGGTSIKNGKTYLEINNQGEDFPAEGLINHTSKELVIIDTCRSYFVPQTIRQDSITKAINEEISMSTKHRALYDTQITEADIGSLILYACSIGETANDTDEGGIFTQSLIKTGITLSKERDSYLYQPVNSTFNQAKIIVSSRYKTQHPVMEGSIRRRTWFPFAVKV